MSITDTDLKKAQIRQLEADILLTQATTIERLISTVYRRDASSRTTAHLEDIQRIVTAVTSGDLRILAEGSGRKGQGPTPLIP